MEIGTGPQPEVLLPSLPPTRRARLARLFSRVLSSRGARRATFYAGLALAFAAAAVVQTWPLARHADTSITIWWFFAFDAWQFLWDMWWVKYAIVNLQTNPFHTDFLIYPQGSDLYLHPLTFINGLMAIPLLLATDNVVLSWNLIALFSFVFSGIGAYLVAVRLTHNRLAGLLAGYIFAFAPFTLMRLGGHYNIFTTWPIPFFALFMLRFQETRRWWDAALAGVFWAILTLNWLEFATDAALLFGIFILYWSVVYFRRGDRQGLLTFWRGAAVVLAVWFLISSPYLVPAANDARSSDYLHPGGDESFSADILSYVTPSPLWGPGAAPLVGGPNPAHLPVGAIETTAYLGGVPLLLATLAFFTVRRNPHRVLFWGIAFFAFAVLALGPYLYIDDSRHHSILGWQFSIPLPYQIYDQIPLFETRRVPARMIMFGYLALAVLAAIGLTFVMEKLRGRWTRAAYLAPVAGVVAIGLVALEYWNPPVHVSELSRPAVLREIRSEPGDFTVVHAPLGRRNGEIFVGDPTGGPLANFYQSQHEKPTFGGYLSRVEDRDFDWFFRQPGLRFLACPTCPDQPSGDDVNAGLVRQFFRDQRIKYVFVHRLAPDGQGIFFVGDGEVQRMRDYLEDVLGMTEIYSDSNLHIYRNPEL